MVSSPHLEHAGHDEGLVGSTHHDPDVEAHPDVTHWSRWGVLAVVMEAVLSLVQWATLSTSRVVVRAGWAGVGGGTG